MSDRGLYISTTLLFNRVLSGDSAIDSRLHLDYNIGVSKPQWVNCGDRLMILGLGVTVLRVRETTGEARLNDGLTLAAGPVGLDDWLLVQRRGAANDHLAISLDAQLGAPVLVRLLFILLTLILTV